MKIFAFTNNEKEVYKVTEISFAKYQVEFPDGFIHKLTDYGKFPGNDIQRWSFMKNTGDWDDEELAGWLGELIEKEEG